MRIRFLKSVASPIGTFNAGSVADIKDDIAKKWCSAGLAMEDKSKEPSESKRKRRSRESASPKESLP